MDKLCDVSLEAGHRSVPEKPWVGVLLDVIHRSMCEGPADSICWVCPHFHSRWVKAYTSSTYVRSTVPPPVRRLGFAANVVSRCYTLTEGDSTLPSFVKLRKTAGIDAR